MDRRLLLKLRQAFLLLSLVLIGMMVLIGGVTYGALTAFNDSARMSQHRQASMALMNEVRGEVDLLGRLVNSYVSTANPLYLIYYYDILGMREGTRPRRPDLPAAYWDQVIAGARDYEAPLSGEKIPLTQRTGLLGFDQAEQAVVSRILQLTEQMKQLEQIAFAATQGLYDPVTREFVSDSPPQHEFAAKLLHAPEYLKLRADLAGAVDELARQVDQRTQRNLDDATRKLQQLIVAALILLATAILLLFMAYYYLTRRLLDPLLQLDATAQALAEQAYGQRVGRVRGFAEVQNLAVTIDGMASAIQADIAHREIVQQQLAEARAKAEVAAEAKSIFLANMSHEIRTPMNAIIGMAYLALKSGLQPTQRNYVSKIHEAAKSLLGILNDILDYSKIEAGKIVLESTSFDLAAVLQNALFMVHQRAQDKRLEVILDCDMKHVGNFMGDPLRLGQVLINLLSNAVKFTEHGHVRMSVVERDGGEGVSTLHFAIEDTGIGMSREQMGRLFQEFSQADGSTTRKYGGTGLGLSISRRLVTSMGGDIEVSSEQDLGSRFAFSIQLQRVSESGDRTRLAIRRRRALVVDHYVPARDSLVHALRHLGCPVVDAISDGEAALAMIGQAWKQGAPYDLVLLDWLLPGLSGRAVVERLQQSGLPLPEKTIFMSALDVALIRDQVVDLGGGDVLQKPVLPRILCEVANSGAPAEVVAGELSGSRQQSLGGMRVLIVEDNELNRQVAQEILNAWGVRVEVANDGQQALAMIFAQPETHYDLILMDLEMPVLSGGDAVRLLRGNTHYAEVPVIAMTAHAVGDELMAAMAAGMNGHVPKPFDPDELFELLQRYHRRPPATSAAFDPPVPSGDQAAVARLTVVPGLDGVQLYRYFPGRLDFIHRMLRRFASEQGQFVVEMEALLKTGDSMSLRRRAHSLKGLAGNLCMPALQEAASAFEAAVKGEEPATIAEALKQLDNVLAPLLAGLALVLGADETPLSRLTQDVEIQQVVKRLKRCLLEGDGEAERLWLGNRTRLSEIMSKLEFQRLERAIAAWAFDEALLVLDAAGKAAKGESND
ncbi:MAG: response regulator [Rhodocyclales bacterium GT-UBC]|nr:MAG: response regulator [Rhodocyclales bacterium GT-UBC]